MNFLSFNPFAAKVPTNLPTSASTSSTKAFDLSVEFDKLVTGQLQDPSRLVCECMRQRAVGMLGEILVKDMSSLCIKGPMDAQGWQTFVDAMPEGFPVSVLTLSNLVFDKLTAGLLFQALGKMPALVNLFLNGVEAQAEVTDASKCLPLKQLKTLNVVEAGSGESGIPQRGRVSVCPLLIQILEACKLQSLSITGLKFEVPGRRTGDIVVTTDQNASLGEALCLQTELKRLILRRCRAESMSWGLDRVATPDEGHLLRTSPLHCLPSLRLLDLSENALSGKTMASILTKLGQDGTCLRHLNLGGNFIGEDTVAAMAFLLVKNGTLLSVSFENAKGLGVNGSEAERLVDEGELKQLTDAVEHNTSLRRLRFETVPGLDRKALDAYLQRNIQFFRASCAVGGMHAVMNGGGRNIPMDIARHVSALGVLTTSDALKVSSVSNAAWDVRQRLLQGDDPSN